MLFYGINAYIRIANGATTPTISFTAEVTEPRTQKSDVPTIYIDTQDNAEIQPSTGLFVPAAIEVATEAAAAGEAAAHMPL